MFGHRYFGARYFGPRYFGPGGSVAPPVPSGPFVSDNTSAGSGRRKRYEPPKYYLPPSKPDEEVRKEREARKKRLRKIAERQEKIEQAEASRKLLAVLEMKHWAFRKRIEAAAALYAGIPNAGVAAANPEAMKLAAMLADTLDDDEISKWEKPVSKAEITRQITDLWMEDPEQFERLWPYSMEIA